MATEFVHPLASGINPCLTLQLMKVYEQWRGDAFALEAKRVENDLGALRHGCEAIANAKDWREFNSGSQSVMSDYCKATTRLWQEGFEAVMRHQGALGEALSGAMKTWQSTWTGEFEKAGAMTPATMPLWFKRLSMPTAFAQLANLQGDGSVQAGKRSRDGDHLSA
ncbi:hypothetical protein LJR034_004032 [Caballeronia sp. LjRoot34]|uniref:hypothetical protein n=1 Tax=Caballeronia sp. LjRoot34 TaxID=3342325 RepID=UPI003ED0D8E3